MNNETKTVDLGRGVAKNGQEIGLQNELTILGWIQTQGWIREKEL